MGYVMMREIAGRIPVRNYDPRLYAAVAAAGVRPARAGNAMLFTEQEAEQVIAAFRALAGKRRNECAQAG